MFLFCIDTEMHHWSSFYRKCSNTRFIYVWVKKTKGAKEQAG